jgi:hypothetical protein
MAGTTLAAALTDAFDKAEVEVPQEAQVTPEVPANEAPTETAAQKADRLRDEAGRFKKADEQPVQPEVSQDAANLVAPVEVRKPPSSWKKEYWEAYQKLDPQVADYINQRESQFASGVSTYRQEAERARELNEAIAPFAQDLQTHGIHPAQWVRNLGLAHQTLVKGTPEQKLATFQKLAQDYGIPIQAIQSGQIDPVMQYVAPLQQTVQELRGQLNNWQQQQQQQEETALQREIHEFAAAHEQFETVKETMAGLLQSGLAPDLKSAYDKALRLNDEAWQAEQHRRVEAEKAAAAEKVAQARAKAISTKSATPAGVMGSGKKDLRSILAENVESVMGGGRV